MNALLLPLFHINNVDGLWGKVNTPFLMNYPNSEVVTTTLFCFKNSTISAALLWIQKFSSCLKKILRPDYQKAGTQKLFFHVMFLVALEDRSSITPIYTRRKDWLALFAGFSPVKKDPDSQEAYFQSTKLNQHKNTSSPTQNSTYNMDHSASQ